MTGKGIKIGPPGERLFKNGIMGTEATPEARAMRQGTTRRVRLDQIQDGGGVWHSQKHDGANAYLTKCGMTVPEDPTARWVASPSATCALCYPPDPSAVQITNGEGAENLSLRLTLNDREELIAHIWNSVNFGDGCYWRIENLYARLVGAPDPYDELGARIKDVETGHPPPWRKS